MGNRKFALLALSALSLAVGLMSVGPLAGQVHRNGFETRNSAWVRGANDAPYKELTHEITDKVAHLGRMSEHLQLMAEKGSYIEYTYAIGRAPVSDELNINVWIKANRPGIQLQARVVLPHEHGTDLDDHQTTLLSGGTYELAGRWQRLELRRAPKLAEQKQSLMRAERNRDVNFSEAYVDRVVLNVYGGPGLTEVWIDDLEVSPVLDNSPFQTTSRPAAQGSIPNLDPLKNSTHPGVVELKQDRLMVDGKPFFMIGIRRSDTPLKILHDALFNTVWLDYSAPPSLFAEAMQQDLKVVAALPASSIDPRLTTPSLVSQELSRFQSYSSLLFYDMGGGLMDEQKDQVAYMARAIRLTDTQRPLAGDVWDGFRPYSRTLDLVSVHRWPLLTSLELTQYRDWLTQRRQLARPGTFLWTWVQTHLPDWYTELVYGQASTASFREPIGPQPEQIKLLSYIALAAGCRGLAFWSDRFLADTHQGRDRLLTLALLNQEIQMIEPMLLTADAPFWVDTDLTDVKAAILRSERGLLVLPMWIGKGAQFVPGQSATAKLTITVPEVPGGSTAWKISPAEVRALSMERVPGGTKVIVPDFGLTACLVFTADHNGPNSLVDHFQNQCRSSRKLAAQWSHDLAQVELEKVSRIEDQLEQAGHTLPDSKELLDNARRRLKLCEEHWENSDYTEAYGEGERALRPLRILMRVQWEQALRGLDTPVSSPYAVSFYTLPKHWQFMDQIQQATPGNNMINDGDFELPMTQTPVAWTEQESHLDNVELSARRVPLPIITPPTVNKPPKERGRSEHARLPNYNKVDEKSKPELGKQCLELEVKLRATLNSDGKPLPAPVALERTFLAINSPAVKLPPGTLVRISAWIYVPGEIKATSDGALFYDSAGGEPLAIRVSKTMAWKKMTLYRRVPASGSIFATMALTGVGQVYFDNVRIEPLLTGAMAGR